MGIRETYTGRFAEMGIAYDNKTRKYSRTILLREIVSSSGEIVTDHVWIKPNIVADPEFNIGDIVKFKAGVEKCMSGYREQRRLVSEKDVELGYTFTCVELIK